GELMEVKPQGYAVDKKFPNIIYVPEGANFNLDKQRVTWPSPSGEGEESIKILPEQTYVRPSGYKVHMEKPPGKRAWRLIGAVADGTLCHKPCTVSGGGKSEISKPISDAIIQGPVFVADFKKDFDRVADLLAHDCSHRFKDKTKTDTRPVFSPERSLGSVIKLLTPATREYTAEYNKWLNSIPQYIKELVFVVKRFYKPEWGDNWREHFSVDIINGKPGNELKCENRKLVGNFLRVGYDQDGAWRTFGLRKDFHPAVKLQMEDDITASVVAPVSGLKNIESAPGRMAVKFVHNCEYRLFQRPDDAIHRGYDRQTEADFGRPGNFFSNYEPLPVAKARDLLEDAIGFNQFTEPMQRVICEMVEQGKPAYFVSTAHPRMVDGKPTKNPRYLQARTDLLNPRGVYLAEIGARLRRRVPLGQALHTPVDVILPGRRNNPPEPGIRPLAVFNPVHYMELPELFMEFICSMTGKSPSTTGAGSEGAMTKAPFNALAPIMDLNNALVSWLLTGHNGFVTAAGYVGPKCRFDHDISLLVPEVFCRMTEEERDPGFLVENGYMEACKDFEHAGKKVLASRLGYRITAKFARSFFGRVFNHPHEVFTEEMLRPELQDKDVFADGMDNIVTTQKRVAQSYFDDGSVALACPPLRALLHVMLHGQHEGKGLGDASFRALFTRESMLASDWYRERLVAQQSLDRQLWRRHARYLEKFLARTSHADEAARLNIRGRLEHAQRQLDQIEAPDYLARLQGTIGAEPVERHIRLASAPAAAAA
ncbi:MAG TPA: hypothetical protein VHH73_05645, partial [Verrucomicrobiae bacterium]|nr:hypothetical protein [Verrucomicrobiae bacterium]